MPSETLPTVVDLSLLDQLRIWVALIVGVAVAASAVGIIGISRMRNAVANARGRVFDRLPALVVLLAFMALMRVLQPLSTELSWVIGLNITNVIYALEGHIVAHVQAGRSPVVTAFLAFMYLYGFAYLLAFPFVAYSCIPDPTPFRETVVAYVVNYIGGLLCYTLFVAYGPRNHLPDLVDSLLFDTWPAVFLFTAPVTAISNVFPSLHTSFAVTVALLAWRTRETFPEWVLIAGVVAACIVVATMYLGIHWATDVVGGLILAILAVRIARRDPLHGRGGWIRSVALRASRRLRSVVPPGR